jgi:hypothetical protein
VVEIEPLLRTLTDGRIDFIVVGGVAAVAHGSPRLTMDLDVVYSRRPDNIDGLVTSLSPLKPYLRGAPPGLPFRWDAETVRRGLNFTLTTSLGDFDILGEIAGGGGYDALLPHSARTVVFGVECLGLEKLIAVKRAAGRPKDLEAIAELEAIWEERRKRGL